VNDILTRCPMNQGNSLRHPPVVAVEATATVAIVAGPAAVEGYLQGGRLIGVGAETWVPGGVATLNQLPDVYRGWSAAASGFAPGIPQTPGGMAGAVLEGVYETLVGN